MGSWPLYKIKDAFDVFERVPLHSFYFAFILSAATQTCQIWSQLFIA